MKTQKLKDLFKATKSYNIAKKSINDPGTLALRIYIDDENFYTGTSYEDFLTKLHEDYVEDFCEKVINLIWNGVDRIRFYCRETTHTIEMFVVTF